MVGFRVLLVEDDRHTLSQLTKLLNEAIPLLVADATANIEEAQKVIGLTLQSNHVYDLAILDFRLPQGDGDHTIVDESVCRSLMVSMPETIVCHMTAFHLDPMIAAHNARVHPAGGRQGFLLDKKAPSFSFDLITKAREVLYGSRIEREIHGLFSTAIMLRPDGRVRSAATRTSENISNRIVDLCLTISVCWRDLTPATKAHIQEFFSVEEQSSGNVTVVMR